MSDKGEVVDDGVLNFYLPFRVARRQDDPARPPTPDEWRAVVNAIEQQQDDALRAVSQTGGAPGRLWKAVPATEAAKALSGEFYTVAERILSDLPTCTGDQTSCTTAYFTCTAVESGAFPGRPLQMLIHGDTLVPMLIKEAWIRLFGTGIGLLGLRLDLQNPSFGSNALLRALHEMVQPAERASKRPLRADAPWEFRQLPEPSPAVRSLWRRDGGTFTAFDPLDDTQRLTELYRVVGEQMPTVLGNKVLVERIPVEQRQLQFAVKPDGDGGQTPRGQKASRQRLRHLTGADDGLAPVDDPELATHRTLFPVPEVAGPQWVERIGAATTLLDWMLALLPLDGKADIHPIDELPADAAGPLQGIRLRDALLRRRLYSYVAVSLAGAVPAARLRLLAHRLAHRFDGRYRPTEAMVENATLHHFEPLAHAVSTQGAAVVVTSEGGEEFLGSFVRDGFVRSYRPLGEICYHEYVHLVSLTQHSAFRPEDPPTPQDLTRLRSLIYALSTYRLYYQFSQISHMAQHNQVLGLWRRALGLDELETAVSRDVQEARQFLEDDDDRRSDYLWRRAGVAGIFLATTLGALEVQDHVAQTICPPDALAVALTDVQVQGATVFPLLAAFQAHPELLRGEAEAPLLDQVCAASVPPPVATPAQPDRYAELRQLLAGEAAGEPERQTWDERLQQVCKSSMSARQCAASATRIHRTWWIAPIFGALAAALALMLMTGQLSRFWRWLVR